MRILTVNAGSTSLKLERYDIDDRTPIATPPAPAATYATLEEALRDEVDAIAHRFVRMPDGAPALLRLDGTTVRALDAVSAEAPLHDTPALRAVAAIQASSATPQYAVSDSAFHRTLSDAAATYAIPRGLTAAGLRRRGYHGLSHEYAAHRVAALAGFDVAAVRTVTLHLGGGSSLCAVRHGISIETTMGYTPLEGVPMATRSGSVDPGLLLHLLRSGMSIDDLEEMLERRSGLLGISGRTGDVRDLLAAAHGDADAQRALDVLVWRLRAAIGAMIGVLGGVDLIAFTGGIGEHAAAIRAGAIAAAAACGAAIDDERNAALKGEGLLSPDGSRVGVYVITARENWQLARAVAQGV